MTKEKIWFAATGRMALLELVRVINVRVINLMSESKTRTLGPRRAGAAMSLRC